MLEVLLTETGLASWRGPASFARGERYAYRGYTKGQIADGKGPTPETVWVIPRSESTNMTEAPSSMAADESTAMSAD